MGAIICRSVRSDQGVGDQSQCAEEAENPGRPGDELDRVFESTGEEGPGYSLEPMVARAPFDAGMEGRHVAMDPVEIMTRVRGGV